MKFHTQCFSRLENGSNKLGTSSGKGGRNRPVLESGRRTVRRGAVLWMASCVACFSGLVRSFIFGIFASTAFSLYVVPVVYFLLNRKAG
jgi:hypothetical protein